MAKAVDYINVAIVGDFERGYYVSKDDAIKAVEFERKEMIDKAVKYLSGLTRCAVSCIGEDVNVPILSKEQLEDFRKAMEE